MTDKKSLENIELPPRPQEPLPGECCGRNCENCVYIYYEKALKRWEEKMESIRNKQVSVNTI